MDITATKNRKTSATAIRECGMSMELIKDAAHLLSHDLRTADNYYDIQMATC